MKRNRFICYVRIFGRRYGLHEHAGVIARPSGSRCLSYFDAESRRLLVSSAVPLARRDEVIAKVVAIRGGT